MAPLPPLYSITYSDIVFSSLLKTSKVRVPANLGEVARIDAHCKVDPHKGGCKHNLYLGGDDGDECWEKNYMNIGGYKLDEYWMTNIGYKLDECCMTNIGHKLDLGECRSSEGEDDLDRA